MPLDRASATELLVPQLMARVSQIQLRTHRLVNAMLAGGYRSSFRGSGIEFEEVRPYMPGDDVRTIDWQRTAKSSEPFVKVYVEERELTLVFVVDTSASMNFGSRQWTKREIGAAFCSFLSFVAQRCQDRVGLCMFGAEPGTHLPPRKGANTTARIVREVIAAPTTHGGTDFKAMFELQERAVRRRSLLFVVSDFEGLDESASEVLARLARRHDVIAVRVIDPLERRLPLAGRIWMREIESGRLIEVDTRSGTVRAAWTDDFDQRSARLAELFVRAGVDMIELGTDKDLNAAIADPTAKYFKLRRRRSGGPA